MKKAGILHTELARHLAGLGHTDTFLIADAGMPIPSGIPIVDLAVCQGVPTFAQVFEAILEEECPQGYLVAEETKEKNPAVWALFARRLGGLSCESIPHEELKRRCANLKFAVRTGECSPFANVILQSGVVF